MKTVVLSFALCLFVSAAFAGNGKFSAPTLESYTALSPELRSRYRADAELLLSNTLVDKAHFKSPSYFTTQAGHSELHTLANELVKVSAQHGRIISIGRSGTGIMGYLAAVLSGLPGMSQSHVEDLPYSNAEPRRITAEQRSALREYLRANKLSPQDIAQTEKPIIFFDFLYTGTGAGSLITAIHEWAVEEGIGPAVKAKMSFFGAYPPRMIVESHLMRLRHDLIRDGGFKEFTKEYIEEQIRERDMPARWEMKDACANVFAFRISDQLYAYAGTHAANTQSSFTPGQWTQPIDRSVTLDFASHVGEVAFVELFYLMDLGRRESHDFLASVNCESALRVR